MADPRAQRAQRVVDDSRLVGAEEHDVAVPRAGAFDDRAECFVRQVLDYRRLQPRPALVDVVEFDPREALGPVNPGELGIGVDFAARERPASRNEQPGHAAAGRIGRTGEHLEIDPFHHVGELGELERHAQIRLVRSVEQHRVGIGQHRERIRQIDIERLFENGPDQRFHDAADLFLRQKRGLDVDLREFRLPVGAQVLVPETARDLVIAVEPGDHEQLLEQLRRLRQRVEFTGMHARGDQVIARSLGGRFGEHRRFDIDKAVLVEEFPDHHGHPIPQHQVFLHRLAPQIEDPMREAHRLGQVFIIQLKRRRDRGIEDFQVMCKHLHLACGEIRIDRSLGTPAHRPDHAQAVLAAHALGVGEGLGPVRIADDLDQPLAIAQVDEDDPAVVAAAVRPAVQGDGVPEVRGVDLAAIMRSHSSSW